MKNVTIKRRSVLRLLSCAGAALVLRAPSSAQTATPTVTSIQSAKEAADSALASLFQMRDSAKATILDVSNRSLPNQKLDPVRNKYADLEGKANGTVDFIALMVLNNTYDDNAIKAVKTDLGNVQTAADAFNISVQDLNLTNFNFLAIGQVIFNTIFGWIDKRKQNKNAQDLAERTAVSNNIKAAATWPAWSDIVKPPTSSPTPTATATATAAPT
jgi:hypothetical protein